MRPLWQALTLMICWLVCREEAMHKHVRDCVAICIGEGLSVRHVDKRRRHLLVECVEGALTFPKTPSDFRWRDNMRSVARRMARG